MLRSTASVSSATVSQEGYLAWCDVASILLSPVPLVPLDFVVDQSAMTLRAHRHELADDPVSSWLYANPGKHFLLRTLPDVIPYASAAASLRPALPKVRVSLPRLNPRNYRLVLDPSTVGMNAGNLRVKYVGTKAANDVALGIRTIDDAPSLRSFGDRLGAAIDEDWARLGLHNAPPGRFDIAFEQTLNNVVGHGGRIKFNLDALDIGRALNGNPAERVGRYTAWELQQVVGNRRWRAATDFFLDGRLLSPDELTKLGIR